jgi:hypothetical protein
MYLWISWVSQELFLKRDFEMRMFLEIALKNGFLAFLKIGGA